MLNNFCFHVYAQKSLFIAENCYAFFLIQIKSNWINDLPEQLKG